MNKSENYAHFSSTLKSLFSLSRKHETKNKHRERRVKEATKLWCTWMDEILTNFRENGQHRERRVKGGDGLYGAS